MGVLCHHVCHQMSYVVTCCNISFFRCMSICVIKCLVYLCHLCRCFVSLMSFVVMFYVVSLYVSSCVTYVSLNVVYVVIFRLCRHLSFVSFVSIVFIVCLRLQLTQWHITKERNEITTNNDTMKRCKWHKWHMMTLTTQRRKNDINETTCDDI